MIANYLYNLLLICFKNSRLKSKRIFLMERKGWTCMAEQQPFSEERSKIICCARNERDEHVSVKARRAQVWGNVCQICQAFSTSLLACIKIVWIFLLSAIISAVIYWIF